MRRLLRVCLFFAVIAPSWQELSGFEKTMRDLRQTLRSAFGRGENFGGFGPTFPPGFPFHNTRRPFGGPHIRSGQSFRWLGSDEEEERPQSPFWERLRPESRGAIDSSEDRQDWSSSIFQTGGGSLNTMTNQCRNGHCRLCINGRCFEGRYRNAVKSGDCPVAVCLDSCESMSTSPRDECPVCLCGRRFLREPCESVSDCVDGGQCLRGACQYDALPRGKSSQPQPLPIPELASQEDASEEEVVEEHSEIETTTTEPPAAMEVTDEAASTTAAPAACEFAYQCSSGFQCQSGSCEKTADEAREHIAGRRCVFSYECPATFECTGQSCVASERVHAVGVRCLHHHDCPSFHLCDRDQLSCYAGGPRHRSAPCRFAAECEAGEVCRDLSCLKE